MKKYLKSIILPLCLILMCGSAWAQSSASGLMLHGIVLDEKGETLPGAMVASEDGKRGAMTDEKGEFTMKVFPTDKFINVSFLG